VALLLFVLMQMLPLPGSFVRLVNPLSYEAQTKRAQVFEEIQAKDFLPSEISYDAASATISASPSSTWQSLCLLAAYIGVFLVMVNTFREWWELRQAAAAIVISSFIMAVFALLQKFSGTTNIYWFHTPRFGGQIFGPFTNRDHFACYMNMAFGLTLGLLLAASRVPEFQAFRTWREKLVWLSSGKASRITLLGFAAALMGATVCLTLSRGGITSLAASLGIVGVAVSLRSATPNRGRVMAAIALLVVAAVVWLGWRPVVERLGTLADVAKDPLGNIRSVTTLDTLRLFGTCPIFGCGFGSFQYVFPIFQSPSIQIGRFWHAHNDIAQLFAEGGVVGAALVALAGILFIQAIRKRFRAAATSGRLFAGGLAVGITAAFLHSFVDYGLHKPANAFLLATLCGMVVAAVHVRHGKRKRRVKVHRTHGISRLSEKQPVAGYLSVR
jgi:O-antigen ligase